jgi:hypothetical protein
MLLLKLSGFCRLLPADPVQALTATAYAAACHVFPCMQPLFAVTSMHAVMHLVMIIQSEMVLDRLFLRYCACRLVAWVAT